MLRQSTVLEMVGIGGEGELRLASDGCQVPRLVVGGYRQSFAGVGSAEALLLVPLR